ncbi:hypothetical protein AAFF_G00093870 [Aldrovandia affinis]|uniref:Uncharacterized protein n=1 Tax=Aldrovandia affinis TaxID=143900 RepID=A0AAD7T4N6_9TELE|nr:hypothetical protein AAFF_G00093870 [Aldrovandia affinis]
MTSLHNGTLGRGGGALKAVPPVCRSSYGLQAESPVAAHGTVRPRCPQADSLPAAASVTHSPSGAPDVALFPLRGQERHRGERSAACATAHHRNPNPEVTAQPTQNRNRVGGRSVPMRCPHPVKDARHSPSHHSEQRATVGFGNAVTFRP